MTDSKQIVVPDIGEFSDVPVIELLVAVGDRVDKEQSLLTLESDKATIEVPAPFAGTIESIAIALGDTISEGDVIVHMIPDQGEQDSEPEAQQQPEVSRDASRSESTSSPDSAATSPITSETQADGTHDCEVIVLGSGPGGYTAAFRAADLGLDVVLVERYPELGGVCLNVGCIPSKALLHTAEVIDMARASAQHGVSFGKPVIDLPALREFKTKVVGQLTQGLAGMAKQRGVRVIQGSGQFTGPHQMSIDTEQGQQSLSFGKAIIAAGSQAIKLGGFPWDDARMMDSTDALDLTDIPEKLLVIGGGIIGLEMATVYHALGSSVTVCEMMDQIMPGTDKDLVRPLLKRIKSRYERILLKTRVSQIEPEETGLKATLESDSGTEEECFDRVLVSIGRSPNGDKIGCEAAGVAFSERGFIDVDSQQRTNVSHIFAIGDIVGQPMLAHKATHEGKVAAEVCAGQKSHFDARVIPSVAYTDPEIAWAGLTEIQAKADGIDYETGVFPWAASGRAIGNARTEGVTKLLFDPETDRLLGAGIVGPHAGDLIAECVLAIEMGCDAADIGLSIHPHPTLSETVAMAAEAFEGTITDLYLPNKQSRAGSL